MSESKDDNELQTGSPSNTSLVQPNLLGSGSRDFFSNISSDLNGIADKTTNMFTGLFGKILITIELLFLQKSSLIFLGLLKIIFISSSGNC